MCVVGGSLKKWDLQASEVDRLVGQASGYNRTVLGFCFHN